MTKTFQKLTTGGKKYLLIPVMPTPNGGLHLGHLSGPYLKMDVLARAQKRNGNHVAMFFGSDVYESYMNLKSWQTGRAAEDLCNENHNRMRNDLDALNIAYDAFINPLDDSYSEDFKDFFTHALKELVDKGVTEIRAEKYLYSEDEKCFVAGCWIAGTCPVCGSGTGSYQCEECGTQYRPMDLVSPVFRKGNYPLSNINDYDLYLVINKKDELLQHLESMNVGDGFIEIAKTYFTHQGNYIRLTNPGNSGITWVINGSNIPHVIFTYTALYFYSLFCGELYKKKFDTALNPFHKDSDVITVASFGIDCTVPYLVSGVALALEPGIHRPIDYLLPNHFFTLENSKFSTSREHAIWGNDIISKTPVCADAVRYYLVHKNPENEMCDFNVDEFINFVNIELADQLQSILFKAWNTLNDEPKSIDDTLSEKLEALLMMQLACLTPPGFQLNYSSTALKEWINLGGEQTFNSNSAYWWLKGFALLAYPVMPDCSISVWSLLGHEGSPLEKDYFQQTEVQLTEALPQYFSTINFEDIKPALPATLFAGELKK